MASDSQDPTRRKHRHSSSEDEAEDSSKRRKHRHHHRHHRHRHRYHDNRKNGDEEPHRQEDAEVGDRRKRQEEDGVPCLPPPTQPQPQPQQPPLLGPDYDMEEGEIIEDEAFGARDDDTVKKGTDSDVEFDGVQLGNLRRESDNCDMGNHGLTDYCSPNSSFPPAENFNSGCNPKSLAVEKSDEEMTSKTTADYNVHLIGGLKIHNEVCLRGNSSSWHEINGDIGKESAKDNYEPHAVLESPIKGSIKRKSYYDDDDLDSGELIKPLSSENNEDRTDRHRNVTCSPSHDGPHKEAHRRNRSKSRDQTEERSQSQSALEEASFMKTAQRKDDSLRRDNRRTFSDSDDDRIGGHNWDYQHCSRDLLNDKEHSSSYGRYTRQVDRHHSRETRDRGREGSRDTWDRNREGREVGGDRRREREDDRYRVNDKGRERERYREGDRDREKARERYRDREREKDKEKERRREKERDRERSSGVDKTRDREREKESDRVSRLHGYGQKVGYDYRDMYYESKNHRNDDHKDRDRKKDREKSSAKVGSLGEDEEKFKRDEDEQADYQERISLQLMDQEEEDLNRIKEESRKRMQAILEKYKSQQLQQQHEPHPENKNKEHAEHALKEVPSVSVPREAIDARTKGADTFVADQSFTPGKSPPQDGSSSFEKTSGAGGLGEGTPKSERSNDIFCDDIFGDSPTGVRRTGKGEGLAIERSGLHDNWDDAEGYYSYRFGELLDGRYEITAAHGKGVFSTVVRAKDLKAGPGDPEEVAIKIIRNNEHMHKAGKEELIILKKLVGADPDNKRHCVRFLSSFKYRNHLCLVFESLHMNLRELLKKFGRNIGLKLTAVRTYSKQLFIALKHLKNCGVLHCDIKPDNMLVNEAKNVLKLCDFGNAMFAGKNEITPYLVSRFYRAPEIILGLPYDHPMDIWSVGCCLFELYTGKVLFPGATNNDMLRLHMELKGQFPKKMLRKGAFTEQHFDQDLNFLATEEDPVTKKSMKRLITSIKPKDIGAIVSSSPGEDLKMLANFKDLLEKIFVLDPDKRITVSQALSHPFITGK
ncbi:uncharacterized protein LOC127806074 [Diospyros lotus]|uniref:uncharacterized protein LOC127806074 n=1 Tax=Diospyros lotus TaxID=55363 RepID=UPI002257D927|nr:uncharacterized protein LOC127806074 [Diospyros lotus]